MRSEVNLSYVAVTQKNELVASGIENALSADSIRKVGKSPKAVNRLAAAALTLESTLSADSIRKVRKSHNKLKGS